MTAFSSLRMGAMTLSAAPLQNGDRVRRLQHLSDRLHLGLARKPGRGWRHEAGAGELAELGVEHPDGVDVAGRKQGIHRPVEADAALQLGKIGGVEADLDDARFVDAGDAGIFEVVVVDLPLARLLNDLVGLALEQRPEHMRLGLFERRGAEGEIDIEVAEISVALLVGDPELIERRGQGELPQPPVDLVRAHAGLLGGVDEMRKDTRLGHHLIAEHQFDLAGNFVGEAGAAGEQIGDHLARIFGGLEQRVARVPGEQRRDDDDGADKQPGHEQDQPCAVAHGVDS